MREHLESRARGLGLADRTTFLGALPDVRPLLAAVDIVVLPSRTEGMSNALLEAMAMARAVVATAVGGTPEVVSDGRNGRLVPAGSPEALASAILDLVRDPAAVLRLGTLARRHVAERFDVARMVARHQALYEALCLGTARGDDRPHARTEGSLRHDRRSGPPRKESDASDPRIAVLYVIWSLQMGGAERVVADLARSLDRRVFRPLVCCLNFKGNLAPGLEAEGIPVFALDKGKGLDLRVLPRLVRLMRRERVQVVHTHLWTSSFWGRMAAVLARVPVVVVTEHNLDTWRAPTTSWPIACSDASPTTGSSSPRRWRPSTGRGCRCHPREVTASTTASTCDPSTRPGTAFCRGRASAFPPKGR